MHILEYLIKNGMEGWKHPRNLINAHINVLYACNQMSKIKKIVHELRWKRIY